MTKLDELTELYHKRSIMIIQKRDLIASVTPQEVQAAQEAINAEFAEPEKVLAKRIAQMEAEVKNEAIAAGETIQNDDWQVVFSPGGEYVTVEDVRTLAVRWELISQKFAEELRAIIKNKKSSASIRERKG